MKYINQNNLLEYLNRIDNKPSDCDYSAYKGWSNLVDDYKLDLLKVGQIEQETTEETDAYWGEDAPIRLNVYPYAKCDIYQCQKSEQLFFAYNELSGHRPEKRYRLIQKELIDIESIVPTTRCKIISKPYDYTIYKLPNMSFELSINKPKVCHIMSQEEVQQFKTNGIDALQNRLKDMNENYTNYCVVSWQ